MFSYQTYSNQMKEVQNSLLNYIENKEGIEENYENLIDIIIEHQILQDKYEMKTFLYLLSQISKNHHRGPNFSDKIKQILSFFLNTIKKYFTSYEIFYIFRKSRNIILFFIQEKIIIMNRHIYNEITSPKSIRLRYHQYLLPELQKYMNKKSNSNFPSDFDEKRIIGENDHYICQLIRKDLIDEFTDYVNRNNYPLNSKIIISIYETNSFLIKEKPTLIEYAMFFGAVKIFKYLYLKGIKLTSSMWFYAIHSNRLQFIDFLESKRILPDDKSFESVFKESIKCHHNHLSIYIKKYLLEKKYKYHNSYYFHYYNFFFFPTSINSQQVLYYACKYDYYIIVKNILQSTMVDLSEEFVLFFIIIFMNEIFFIFFHKKLIELALNNNSNDIVKILVTRKDDVHLFGINKNSTLSNFTIPYSVVSIECYEFCECYRLIHISIPSSVISIGDYAFYNCVMLKEIIIPSSVTSIGISVFEGCISLERVKLSGSITIIEESTFSGCSSLSQIFLPESLHEIGDYAFLKCSSLKSISFPSSLLIIGQGSFADCTSLTKIVLPYSVSRIGEYAFCNCSSLMQKIIPSKETDIAYNAFNGCYSLSRFQASSNKNHSNANTRRNYCNNESNIEKNDSKPSSNIFLNLFHMLFDKICSFFK